MSKSDRKPIFKIGDIVYLVSGGPAMAVQEPIINTYKEFTGDYNCQWFSGRKHERARFPEESLTTTNPKP
ncbi:YodC family protein [Pectobacterium aroidearum]|uniref:YodC family protein n=1 Tax=Pectobacterium aroidearum TaxID=1201031 RepID=UPI003016829D